MRKRILIIGGMGPQASLVLHSYLIQAAIKLGAVDNQDYPLIVHVSVPVEDFISDKSAKPRALAMITETLKPLADTAFTDAVIACNTAHLLYDDITEVLGMRPHSLMGLVDEEIERCGQASIGLLATPTTIESQLFGERLTLGMDAQRATTDLIRGVLAGKTSGLVGLRKQVHQLQRQGAKRVILGCTELSVLNQMSVADEHVIDPLKLAAQKIMGIEV